MGSGKDSVVSVLTWPNLKRGTFNFPADLRMRGVNHVLKFEDADVLDEKNAWAALWRVWDWPNWIKPQLDDISTLGNAVRFWGNTLVLAQGNITLEQYLDRWIQVLDYTKSLGLLMYPCGGDLLHWGDYSLAASKECYGELSAIFAGYEHVIGMDIANESSAFPWNQQNKPTEFHYQQPIPYTNFLLELGDSVRSNSIPITYSRNLWKADQWLQENSLDASGDFIDIHVYYTPGIDDSKPIYGTQWGSGKKLIVGEFGMGLNMEASTRDTHYTAVRNMAVSDENCVGAFAWSAYDPFTTPVWETGLFDRQRVPREDIVAPFLTLPVT